MKAVSVYSGRYESRERWKVLFETLPPACTVAALAPNERLN
jgi:hypothetical protein